MRGNQSKSKWISPEKGLKGASGAADEVKGDWYETTREEVFEHQT